MLRLKNKNHGDFLHALVVALYLHEKWWHVDDVLRTSSKSRNGLEMVRFEQLKINSTHCVCIKLSKCYPIILRLVKSGVMQVPCVVSRCSPLWRECWCWCSVSWWIGLLGRRSYSRTILEQRAASCCGLTERQWASTASSTKVVLSSLRGSS